MSTDQQHFAAARQFQEFYDPTLRKVGAKAPQPILGMSVNDYRREALRTMKRTFLPEVHPLFGVQFRSLRSDALAALEPRHANEQLELTRQRYPGRGRAQPRGKVIAT